MPDDVTLRIGGDSSGATRAAAETTTALRATSDGLVAAAQRAKQYSVDLQKLGDDGMKTIISEHVRFGRSLQDLSKDFGVTEASLRRYFKELEQGERAATVAARESADAATRAAALQEAAAKREADAIKQKVLAAKQAADAQDKLFDNIGRVGQGLTSIGAGMTAAFTLPIVGGLTGAATAAIKFESSFANVKKTVNATEPELNQLSLAIRKMAKEIPQSTEELSAIAATAGQMGVEAPNIEKFTRNVAALSVAVDGISGEEAAMGLAQIGAVTKTSMGDIDKMSSALVNLGNNGNSTEGQILDFTKRLAGAGNQIHLTVPEIMALGGTMANLGINAEAGGTAFSTVLSHMAEAVATGGSSLDAFARVAGKTTEEFATLFRTKPIAAIQAFMNGLSDAQLQGQNLYAILGDVGAEGTRMRDVLLRMAGAGGELGKQLQFANDGWSSGNAHLVEAEKKYGTTANQAKVLWNNVKDLGIVLGASLIPALGKLMEAGKPLIDTTAAMIQGFVEMPAGVQAAGFGLLAFVAVGGPMLMVIGKTLEGVHALYEFRQAYQAIKTAEAVGEIATLTTRFSVLATAIKSLPALPAWLLGGLGVGVVGASIVGITDIGRRASMAFGSATGLTHDGSDEYKKAVAADPWGLRAASGLGSGVSRSGDVDLKATAAATNEVAVATAAATTALTANQQAVQNAALLNRQYADDLKKLGRDGLSAVTLEHKTYGLGLDKLAEKYGLHQASLERYFNELQAGTKTTNEAEKGLTKYLGAFTKALHDMHELATQQDAAIIKANIARAEATGKTQLTAIVARTEAERGAAKEAFSLETQRAEHAIAMARATGASWQQLYAMEQALSRRKLEAAVADVDEEFRRKTAILDQSDQFQKAEYDALASQHAVTVLRMTEDWRLGEEEKRAELLRTHTLLGRLGTAAREAIATVESTATSSFARMLVGATGFRDGMLDIWRSLQQSVANILTEILNDFTGRFLRGIIGAMAGRQGAFSSAFGGILSNAGGSSAGGLLGIGGAGATAAYGGLAPGVAGQAGVGFGGGTASAASGGAGILGTLAGPAAGGILGGLIGYKTGSKTLGILSGVGAGAGIGAMFGGPLGAGIGAGVGALTGLLGGIFGNQGKKTNRERDSWVKQFTGEDELPKAQAQLRQLAAEAGVTDAEMRRLFDSKQLKDFAAAQQVVVDKIAQQTQETEDADAFMQQFTGTLETVASSGALVTKEFAGTIEKMKEMGAASAEIDAFVTGQVTRAVGGLNALVTTSAITTQQSAGAVTSALAASFTELTNRGMSAAETIQTLGPTIGLVEEQLKKAGLSGGAAWDQVRAMAAIAGDEIRGPLLDGIHGGTEALVGLQNAGVLNQEMFSGLTSQIVATRDELLAAGTDGAAAMQLIAPDIQRIWELQQDFGYQVDASTQALIDQAVQATLVGDAHRNAQDKATKAMEAAALAMEKVGKALERIFGTAAAQAEDFAGRARAAIDRIPRSVDTEHTIHERVVRDEEEPTQADVAHTGGLIGSMVLPTRRVPSSLFSGAPIFHKGGEVPAILQRGEGVLSKDTGMPALGRMVGLTPSAALHVLNDGAAYMRMHARATSAAAGYAVAAGPSMSVIVEVNAAGAFFPDRASLRELGEMVGEAVKLKLLTGSRANLR